MGDRVRNFFRQVINPTRLNLILRQNIELNIRELFLVYWFCSWNNSSLALITC